MRQAFIDGYTAWINWFFDHPWAFAVAGALYIGVLIVQYKHPRKPWRR